ncbi:DUF4271 domain-containing protein [Ulvibacter litoralis]|uniref:DUF4271 domain-containing protein n=1 Tax=Ulvibacter litoralis TaxID=227084 RepID=A0A1G7CS05_9FLAO|nr:DUF4271 domain-containing protein [Ulvibacter litoralis]GHC46305.1 DUF4271 domain-containing protein [Ulvibacter litoralis]SDE41991.1 protein of unknown function [Ulvibacter litoralis]
MQYVERYTESLDWITLFLVGCVVLYTIAKYAYPKRFDEFILLPINNKYFFVHGKNDDIKHPFNILLFINQVISVSIFLFLFLKVMRPEVLKTNPWLFLQICSGYSIFILIKFSIEKIVGSIFSIDALINNYLYQKLSYRNLLAIALFIGNLIFFYTLEPSLNILLSFIAIILILNGIALFNSYKSIGKIILANFFYFILYLCALEIAPYYILYKVLH